MSSLYGSDAMGGVINIITRRVQQEWTTSLRADTTLTERKNSGNTGQGSFYTSGPLVDGLLGVKAQGQYSHRGEDKIIGGFNRQIMTSGGATLSFTPDDKNTIDAEYKRDNQHRDDREGYTSARGDGSGFSKYELNHMALTHTGIYDIATTDTYVQYDETKNPGRKMKAEDLVFRNQSVFLLGDHSVSLGGQYRKEKLKDEGNKFPEYNKLDRYSWALFAEDEWLMTNDFAVTGGIRMDKDENYGNHWTPRLYGVWHADDQWTIKGGVTTGYKAPSLRESSPTWGQATGGRAGNAVIYGNPDLKPEKSVTEEIGVIWNNQDNLTAGITIYNTDFKDKITEVRRCEKDNPNLRKCSIELDGEGDKPNQPYNFISEKANVDKARMRGVEVTFNWSILENLEWANNYTFTDTEQRSGVNKGKPLNKQPKHMVNSTLTWGTTEDLQTWTRMNFRGKTSDYQGRGQAMNNGTPSYALFDLGASYSLNKNANIVAGVYNVLDRRIDSDNYGAELEGRRYNIGINYNF